MRVMRKGLYPINSVIFRRSIITKFDIFKTYICGNVTGEGVEDDFASIRFDCKSRGLKFKKDYFCCFYLLFQSLKPVKSLFFIDFFPDFEHNELLLCRYQFDLSNAFSSVSYRKGSSKTAIS